MNAKKCLDEYLDSLHEKGLINIVQNMYYHNLLEEETLYDVIFPETEFDTARGERRVRKVKEWDSNGM